MEKKLSIFKNQDTFKFGFKDENGSVIIQPIYNNCLNFSEGLAACNLNGKWGFINEFGNIIIPFQYFRVFMFSNGMAGVNIDNLWGFINKSNKLVIKCKYNNIYESFGMFAGVKEPVAIVGVMTEKHRERQTRLLINRDGKILDDDIDL
ncbi:MAG: WG repeat-containing protein [Paludibacter sp.]|nr:WG repeat-containing protein [Paludibacter sp.]